MTLFSKLLESIRCIDCHNQQHAQTPASRRSLRPQLARRPDGVHLLLAWAWSVEHAVSSKQMVQPDAVLNSSATSSATQWFPCYLLECFCPDGFQSPDPRSTDVHWHHARLCCDKEPRDATEIRISFVNYSSMLTILHS